MTWVTRYLELVVLTVWLWALEREHLSKVNSFMRYLCCCTEQKIATLDCLQKQVQQLMAMAQLGHKCNKTAPALCYEYDTQAQNGENIGGGHFR